mgnify:FL=1
MFFSEIETPRNVVGSELLMLRNVMSDFFTNMDTKKYKLIKK